MSRLVILSIEDGSYYHAGELEPSKKQRRVVALREWIQKHGEDGKIYRLAGWLTLPLRARKTFVMEPIAELDSAPVPEGKELKEATKK